MAMGGGNVDPPNRLDEIETDWGRLGEPARFALHYATAIRAYLLALLRDPTEADEVAQQFMLRVVAAGFRDLDPRDGRFRDYLKAALRNAARTHRRREAARPRPADAALDQLAGPPTDPDRAWLDGWRRCLLDRVWDAVADHQRRSPGNLAWDVLRATLENPDEDSAELAARVAAASGTPLRPDAFRKQLSRARHLFAGLLISEVTATVRPGTPDQIAEELAALGLLRFVRRYLRPE